VFTIALNTAKNNLDKQNRWKENAQDFGAKLHSESPKHFEKFKAVFQTTPEREYEIKEHISYCFNCINKTSFEEKKMMGGLCFMVDNKMCIGVDIDKKQEFPD